jgi:hypothetical protein
VVESSAAQIGLVPVTQFELAALLCRGRVDAGRLQAAQVFIAKLGVNDVENLLAALEAFLDEREQQAILLIRAVEKGADMTVRAQSGAAEPDRLAQCTVLDRVHFFPLAADALSVNRGLAADGKDHTEESA